MVRLWGSSSSPASTTINNFYNYYGVHSTVCTPASVTQELPTQWGTNTPQRPALGLTFGPSPVASIVPLPTLGVVNPPAPPVVPPPYSAPAQDVSGLKPGSTPAMVTFPLPQYYHSPMSQCSILDPLVVLPFPNHHTASPSRSCLKLGRSKSSKRPVDDLLPTKKRPLHRNLIDIDWDLRQPLTAATCWSRPSGSSSKLDQNANATISGIEEIEMILETEDTLDLFECGTSGAINALFNSTWGGSLVAEARNGPLTVGCVLRVLQNFLYEVLRADELQYLYNLGLYQKLLDANANRVGSAGQWFSHGDIGRFRRIDLFGSYTRFRGLDVERNDRNGTLTVKCSLGKV